MWKKLRQLCEEDPADPVVIPEKIPPVEKMEKHGKGGMHMIREEVSSTATHSSTVTNGQKPIKRM